jgi:hypothetical protein
MIFQEQLDQLRPIICWFLIWFINDIISYSIASVVDSASLTEGLDNFSIMASSGVGALEEAIQAR